MEEELDRQRQVLEGKEREYNKLSKDFDFEKEREAVLLGDRYMKIEISLRIVEIFCLQMHEFLLERKVLGFYKKKFDEN